MRHFLIALALLAGLAGCSEKNPDVAAAPLAERSAAADSPSRYLAYEHAVQLEVEESRVAEVHQATLAACTAAQAEHCVILESRLSSGARVFAEIRLRAAPEGIKKLLATLGQQGKIASQSVTAEDLAGPLEDAAKKLAMLNDYRTKLEALRSQASKDIEAMIKVNKELAETQAAIEEISGARAHNLQRVNSEILRLSIAALEAKSPWRPIGHALENFGDDLGRAASGAITAVAYLIPWSLVFLLFTWLGRQLWLRRKKPKV
ncbi:MAG: DUF4349 domain-containing protein [Azonexus sp.]